MQIADNMATRLCFIFFIRVETLKKRWLVITSEDDSSLARSLARSVVHIPKKSRCPVEWNGFNNRAGRVGGGAR